MYVSLYFFPTAVFRPAQRRGEGATRAVCLGSQVQDRLRAPAQDRLPQHTDKLISFMFQMKIKQLNKIRYFYRIYAVYLFIERWALTLRQGRTCMSSPE